MKGVHSPATDQSATEPAEIIEVGSGFETPVPELPAKRKRRSTLLRVGALVAFVIAGLALMPGNNQAPTTVTDGVALREPATATSTIPASPAVVSVVTDDRFSLIPVADLNGFAKIAGPVLFGDRYWVAASQPMADHVVMLSSIDGSTWIVEGQLVGPDQVLHIEDVVVFRSRLAVIATSSNSRPTPQGGFAETLLAWTSADGRSWFLQLLPEKENIAYWDVRAVAGGDQVMVWGGIHEAYGELIYPSIPIEFDAALAAGQLLATWERGSDLLRVSVVAPPGLEVFSTEVPVSGPHLTYGTRLLRSDDLAVWTEVDPTMAAGWDLTWSEDVGFVLQSINGGTMNSSDGLEWQSTEIPAGSLLPWGSGLLGLVNANLMFFEDGAETMIRLPSEMFIDNTYPWIDVGPGRLIAAATTYEIEGNSTQQVVSGNLLLTSTGSNLIVSEGRTERVRIQLWTPPPVLPVTYDPVAESVTIDPGNGEAAVILPLDDLDDFLSNWQPGRTDLYQSQDGLVWSRAESALLSNSVTLIGAIEDGFLIGMGGIGDLGEEETMTVFRTGPID